MNRLATSLVLALLIAAVAGSRARAAEKEEDEAPAVRPAVRVQVTPSDITLDGRLDDPAWAAVSDSIANLTMVEPREGGVPDGRTVVKVLATPDAIVFGIDCQDNNPAGIVAFSKARDSNLEQEDHVLIVLDPFLDGRSGYVFAVNAAGARFDGLPSARGEEVNSDWDGLWDAKTSRDAHGWYAEIRIPAASIGFKKGLDTWGFNVQRRVQRLQETSRWSGATADYEIYQTSRAGLLQGIPPFQLGVGLSARPSVVSRVSKPHPGADPGTHTEVSFDGGQRLGPNLLAALTVNTDFSETEVDVRQINLTRFPILFPEKRTFFLARADIFEFGLGLDEETLIPFYSRRIGLVGPDEDDQIPVPINVGGKVTGRVGGTDLGALVVNTGDLGTQTVAGSPLHLNETTMGAIRVRQDVLKESNIGFLGTFGDQLGRKDSWSGGIDATYQTSELAGDQNFLVGGWGMLNDRKGLTGDKSAYGGSIDYPNDLWDANLTVTHIGDGFDPSLSFVPRRNVQITSLGAIFAPRPAKLVRQMFHEVTLVEFTNLKSGKWESYTAEVKPIDWLLESGDRFDASLKWEGDRPPKEFEVAPDIDIAPGSYEWGRYGGGFILAEKRRISGEIRGESGNFYNGTLNTVSGRVTARIASLLTLEVTGERNRGKVFAPENESVQHFEKHFKQDVMGLRVEINMTPDLQVSSLTQYDTESRELGSNTRLRWTFVRGGDIFLVYNHNEIRRLNNDWAFVSSEVPLKVQYEWRF